MSRVSVKIVGAQGQGVNSVGELCAKGLKRAGYSVFGYKEYMSLIKGGHSSYQLDISNHPIASNEELVDILVCFNHHGLEKNLGDVKPGGYIVHVTADWEFTKSDAKYIRKNKITVVQIPVFEILRTIKARPILANVLITSIMWSLLGQNKRLLRTLVQEQFAHKGKELVQKNWQCIDAGMEYAATHEELAPIVTPKKSKVYTKQLLLTGSDAMGLGLIHAGCRVYIGYPMTPSSPLLKYVSELQNKTGMVIKQAEDEITAAQMASGAMFMGTRAMTGTSGGGYDLMTETISLNGMIENPCVIMLAQRPGPATGLPTWTGQGDLLLAVHSAHGEFPRLVMAASDADDSFYLMNDAFNAAEQYQCPVTILTDKQIAEALYTQPVYQQNAIVDRGSLVTGPSAGRLESTDRYDPKALNGISVRWLPGTKAATYVAQGDEHSADGSVDESAENAVEQMEKRMSKFHAMADQLPQPTLFGARNPEILLVGWGSTKGPVLDALEELNYVYSDANKRIGYLHYTYMWPLKTDLFYKLHEKAKRTIVIEGNYQGQLAMLLQQEVGVRLPERILKYDGRPFFLNELSQQLTQYL